MITRFQRELEEQAQMKLQLKINDNRSTMLSVRWEPDRTKVSLHRMFLQAPKNVMEALACYIRREHEEVAFPVRYYIEKNIKHLDYSQQLDRKKIYTQGTMYNLQELYNRLNREYFDAKLDLQITWFGKPYAKNRSHITLGLYYDPLKLIKISRLLDTPSIPEYVIEYVIYHEMLHFVCPSYHDKHGVHHIHSKEFKEKEMQYRYYQLAQNRIKEYHENLFI